MPVLFVKPLQGFRVCCPLYPGCASRPWASECNRFAVKLLAGRLQTFSAQRFMDNYCGSSESRQGIDSSFLYGSA